MAHQVQVDRVAAEPEEAQLAQTELGGGGGGGDGSQGGGTGGDGVVFIRRLTASSCSSSGCTSTCGCDTIHEFTADGTFTA